jgi:hypothetical protein
MPKILINERDYTNPGTPDGYSNYAVLIAGFRGDGDGKTVMPDSNGVYEFSSSQDFKDTIGLMAPHFEKEGVAISHYGNQMAYELLNLGYSVLYLPVEPETCVETLKNKNTWEIFKDKASYDFRFITHGLLESSDTSTIENRLTELHSAIATLNKSVLNSDEIPNPDSRIKLQSTTNFEDITLTLEQTEEFNELYTALYQTFEKKAVPGLINLDTGAYYESCFEAVKGVLEEVQTKTTVLDSCVITASTINDVNANIADLAKYVADEEITGRGDCIALIELDENSYVGQSVKPESAIITAIRAMDGINTANGKYCAMTVPSVVYHKTANAAFGNNNKFPGAFHYLACFMSSLRNGFAEWYAAAGYTRGVSNYIIDHTTVTLGENAINALEPRNTNGSENSPKIACNVIANFRGSYYLWGNRTAHPLGDANSTEGDLVASHFLNIRQLCTTIKKQLYVACRRFTFDPNSDTLWFNFVNAIRPTLEAMKADQGIRDYKIMKVYTDKKATIKAKIRIIPIEAVEDFNLEVSLEDSFGETAAVVTE